MGASPPQLRGAVLARLKAEFSLVAMKAGCMRAMESLPAVAVEFAPPPLRRPWVGLWCFRPPWWNFSDSLFHGCKSFLAIIRERVDPS